MDNYGTPSIIVHLLREGRPRAGKDGGPPAGGSKGLASGIPWAGGARAIEDTGCWPAPARWGIETNARGRPSRRRSPWRRPLPGPPASRRVCGPGDPARRTMGGAPWVVQGVRSEGGGTAGRPARSGAGGPGGAARAGRRRLPGRPGAIDRRDDTDK